MKYTHTEIVYRDKVTGMYYRKMPAFRPIACLDNLERPSARGYVLKPTGSKQPDWPLIDFESWYKDGNPDDRYGYVVGCLDQSLFVTETVLAERFEYMGEADTECDTEHNIQEYEAEYCDFSKPDYVAKHAINKLVVDKPAFNSCVLHTLIETYLKVHKDDPECKAQLDRFFNSN